MLLIWRLFGTQLEALCLCRCFMMFHGFSKHLVGFWGLNSQPPPAFDPCHPGECDFCAPHAYSLCSRQRGACGVSLPGKGCQTCGRQISIAPWNYYCLECEDCLLRFKISRGISTLGSQRNNCSYCADCWGDWCQIVLDFVLVCSEHVEGERLHVQWFFFGFIMCIRWYEMQALHSRNTFQRCAES